jgi:hypothetical protein
VQGATGGLQTTGEIPQEGDLHGALFTCPHHAPTDPPKPPHRRSPAHDNNSHPNPHPNGNDTMTSPTTHHTSTTTTTACPRTQHTAHPPQPPQTCRVTQRGSTHNNDGHPDPHPKSKDTTTGPTAHHTPRTTTHDSHCRLSQDTAHGPAAPTTSSHRKPTPAPTTSDSQNSSKAHAGQVLTAPHTHAHAHSPDVTAGPQGKSLTWHHPSASLPDLTVQPPDAAAPHPCHPPPALPMHHQYIAGDGGAQVGELIPEPLLLPCTPLPYKEWGYVVLLIIR